jgi:SAM-dependent methyltransferase
MSTVIDKYRQREFWAQENLRYSEPHFRMRKCANLLNALARNEGCDLLDVGCGPAALKQLLDPGINYHGIDIAIHAKAPYLVETNFLEAPIAFKGAHFDLVVACGVFEYAGRHQEEKFAEIRSILRDGGRFVMSYINFGHFRRHVSANYNNIQSIRELTSSLKRVFHVDRRIPVYHHWRHKAPGRSPLPEIQMRLNCGFPFLSSWLVGEYFFVCSAPKAPR